MRLPKNTGNAPKLHLLPALLLLSAMLGALAPARPLQKQKPSEPSLPNEPARLVILPPDPKPAFHGPRVVGETPGRAFLFRIPATGDGPLTFAAKNLPPGLKLDPKAGVIAGSLEQAGTTVVELSVRGARGAAKRKLTIVGGDRKIALTPPMGWNTFNIWAGEGDSAKVRAAADAFIAQGLAAHGYQYVNIDDCWEGVRDANGVLQPNAKFADMQALIDHIHSLGLKVGIYSSPGPQTCKGLEGSYQHEEQDAATFAKWGVDYLKYDWCSYTKIARKSGGGLNVATFKKPFAVMRAAMDKTNRDMVYSLSEAGFLAVWQWGADVGANCWRTTGDIKDNWPNVSGILFSQNGHEKYAEPSHWNDPDMLVVGTVGWGQPRPNKLTQNEQLLHFTMWCLLASPLIMGCELTHLDPVTRALLTNDEALDIDQEPLGKAAGRKFQDDNKEVWARPLFDGTTAVGLFNLGTKAAQVTARWSDLNLSGSQPVRDLWLHKNLGNLTDSYTTEVPAHGVVLLKIGKPTTTEYEPGK